MATNADAGTLFCSECGRPTPPEELARFGDTLVCPLCKENYAQKLREGVAPAVAMRYAGFWVRFLAVVIDTIIMMVVNTITSSLMMGGIVSPIPQITPGTNPMEVLPAIFAVVGASMAVNTAISALYESLFIAYLAATPGKMAMGLKVIRANGSPVGIGRSFGRHFAKYISGLILGIGYIMAAFDTEKRGLHDMICDTRVIQTR
jgi:uncharacterized RDD family membrane protein YckC